MVLLADVADANLKAYLAWISRQAHEPSDVPSAPQRKQRTCKQQDKQRLKQPGSRLSPRQHGKAQGAHAQATPATAARTRSAAAKAVIGKDAPVCSAAVGCDTKRGVTRSNSAGRQPGPDRASQTAVGQTGHQVRKRQRQLHKGSH